MFNMPRPPFFPSPFMPPPQPLSFMMHPRFSMSPITHLITNASDETNSEMIDSANFIPHSTNYDTQANGHDEISSPPDGKDYKI